MKKYPDIVIGDKYGKLLVLMFDKNKNDAKKYWICKCECGTVKSIREDRLKSGGSKSCGCYIKDRLVGNPSMNRMNIEGKRFGKLVVLEFSHVKNKKSMWRCLCDCGKKCIVIGSSLKSGNTTSCGCNYKFKQGESSFNALFNSYKRAARKRNLKFELSKEDFRKITIKNCYYCGGIPSNKFLTSIYNNGAYVYNGIDRVDNMRGYVLDNCVPCCETCNKAKQTMSVDEFYEWIDRVYHHIHPERLPIMFQLQSQIQSYYDEG